MQRASAVEIQLNIDLQGQRRQGGARLRAHAIVRPHRRRVLALSISYFVSLCLAFAGTAFGDRGRATFSEGTLLSDQGSPLRGTRYALDWLQGSPPEPGWIEALPSRGINALHVYAESAAVTTAPGENLVSLDEIVLRTRNSDLYLVITIGGGASPANPFNMDMEFAGAFWEIYAPRYADETHVIYELQNEAWFDCSLQQDPCIAQPSPVEIIEFEADVYEIARCAAPETPILFFSYGFLYDGKSVLADISGVQKGIASRDCAGSAGESPPSLEWTKAGVAFHGYAGATVTESAVRQITAGGHGLVEAELAPPGSGDLEIPLVVAHETTRTSWFSFLPWHELDDSHWNEVLDAAGIVWAADEGDYPGTSDPPIGSAIALWSPVGTGAHVRVDTATGELIADAVTETSAARFQIESIAGTRYAALRAEVDGDYVQRGADDHLRADSSSPVAFEWIDLPDGEVTLQAKSNWRFVAADYNLSPPALVADRPLPGGPLSGAWERFEVTEPPTCVPDSETLCLLDDRFAVTVDYVNQHNNNEPGTGRAVPYLDQTGFFWFFQPSNIEVAVKILDGSATSGYFLVFFGGLTNIEYTVTVTDVQRGLTESFFSPADDLCGGLYTQAFPGDGEAPWTEGTSGLSGGFTVALPVAAQTAGQSSSPDGGSCVPTSTVLCLLDERFQLELEYRNQYDGGAIGAGQQVPLTDETGLFWFFEPSNIELVVKMLDGVAVNGRFWMLFGSLTNLEFTLTLTDTVTGTVREYYNPPYEYCGQIDSFVP